MSTEYKQKNDLPDLYNILGLTIDVCKETNCDELIKKAYVKKAKVCHPDKHPGRKDVGEVFELLTSAYDIIKDESQRTAYNHKLSLSKQSSSDFLKLKKSATDYAQALGEYVDPTEHQKLYFKEQMSELNAKHNYNASMIDPISQQDVKKKINDLNKTRSEQDKTLKPERLFDDGRFDLKKFNAAFDNVHTKDDKAIINHGGVPTAWNDLGTVANYSNFDDLNNLYVEDGNRFDMARQTFGSVEFTGSSKKMTKDDLQNINGADYVDGHNVLGEDYYKDMKARLRDRNEDATGFEKMKYGDFKRDDTAGYGIFDQLGFKFDDRLALDVDDDNISKKYEKLMAERQQELLPTDCAQPTVQKKPVPRISKNSR